MRSIFTGKNLFLMLLPFVLLAYAGCSQVALFDLVAAEQEGAFSLGIDSVNLKVDSQFKFSSVGGYLPYTYGVNGGADPGVIDSATGIYTAPGTEAESTVECRDGIGDRDSARVFIYIPIAADPASFSIHLDDPPQEIILTGGRGSLTATAELGEIASPATVSPGESVSYTPPAGTGTDYIEVTDELDNNFTVRVDVLSATGDVELEILPGYAVLAPDETELFTITNNTGNSLTVALSDPLFGSIIVSAGETSVEYTAPGSEGAVFLTVTDDSTGDFVQADIYVQAEVLPLEITPGTVEVFPGTTVEFSASGGVPPYLFSQLNGSGTLIQISPTTARYTPESVISMIRVTDGVGNQAKVKIQVR